MSIRSTMLVYEGAHGEEIKTLHMDRKMNNENKGAASASLAELFVGVFQRYQGIYVRPRNQRN